MDKIILEIKKQIELQGLSETQAAKKAGLEQSKVNRLLAGKTKRFDVDAIKALQKILGIVAEPDAPYGVSGVHQIVSPEEAALLEMLRTDTFAREGVKALIALPERRRRINLLKMLEELEELNQHNKGKG